MPTYCPRCGSPRHPEAQFCATCGFDFSAIDTPLAPTGPAPLPLGESTHRTSGQGRYIDVAPSDAVPTMPLVRPSDVTVDQAPMPADGPTTTYSIAKRRSMAIPLSASIIVVALLGSLVYGFTTTQTLDQSKADLSSTKDSLIGAQSQLDSTTANLTKEAGARSEAEAEGTRLQNQVADLQDQLAARDACVAALKADEEQLQQIQREQIANFNRSATDSALVKAGAAYEASLIQKAQDYYNAFSNAWDGNYATANSWVSAGNSASRRADAQVKAYNAEISKINAGTKKIESEEMALSESIAKTLSLCGVTAQI